MVADPWKQATDRLIQRFRALESNVLAAIREADEENRAAMARFQLSQRIHALERRVSALERRARLQHPQGASLT